jgi:hypothetical protein
MGSFTPLLLNSFTFPAYNSIDAFEPMNRLNNRCIMQQKLSGHVCDAKHIKVAWARHHVLIFLKLLNLTSTRSPKLAVLRRILTILANEIKLPNLASVIRIRLR